MVTWTAKAQYLFAIVFAVATVSGVMRRVAFSSQVHFDRLLTRQRFHFLHIGKTAGTQTRYVLSNLPTQRRGYRFTAHPHYVKLRDLPETADYFFGIRNPVDRFVSGFYSRKRRGRSGSNEWNQHEQLTFQRFPHANDLAESLGNVDRSGEHAFFGMRSIKHVNMMQADWFDDQGYFLDNRPTIWIVRVSSFNEDLRSCLHRMGIRSSIRTSTDQPISHATNYDGIPRLSEQAIANLEAWYWRDFRFTAHCTDWLSNQ